MYINRCYVQSVAWPHPSIEEKESSYSSTAAVNKKVNIAVSFLQSWDGARKSCKTVAVRYRVKGDNRFYSR